jgi:hypothetical protein
MSLSETVYSKPDWQPRKIELPNFLCTFPTLRLVITCLQSWHDVSSHGTTASEDTAKWMMKFNSPCQIGLIIRSHDVLTVVSGYSSLG